MKVVRNGAMISVRSVCNNHHEQTWDSCPTLGTGASAVAVINLLLAVNLLTTGLHIKQVGFGSILFQSICPGHNS